MHAMQSLQKRHITKLLKAHTTNNFTQHVNCSAISFPTSPDRHIFKVQTNVTDLFSIRTQNARKMLCIGLHCTVRIIIADK